MDDGVGGAATSRTAATRERLVEAALDLAERHGFERVSVRRIAERAGVTEMTFFRYFGSKEAVILHDPFDPVVAAHVAAQPVTLAPLPRVVAGLRAAVGEMPAILDLQTHRRVRIIADDRRLRTASLGATAQTCDVVAEALVRDGADRLAALVAATACLTALHVALIESASRDAAGSVRAPLLAALDLLAGDGR